MFVLFDVHVGVLTLDDGMMDGMGQPARRRGEGVRWIGFFIERCRLVFLFSWLRGVG